MAKIRGIKPEFWTDEDVVELSIPARLLFIGMWNFACDNGHLDDKPRQIKMRILPADDVDIDALLDELEQADRIVRDGTIITIPKFTQHQKPHKRWFSTCDQPLCAMPEGYGKPEFNSGTTVAQPLANGGPTADGDGDGEGEGDGDKPRRKRPARAIPDDWQPNSKHEAYAKERGLDLAHEAFRFRNHAHSVDRRVANWNAAFTNWLSKAYPKENRATVDARNSGEWWR